MLRVRQQITERGVSFGTTLYFIDKDVDDLVGQAVPSGDDIFCTAYYSIENYLVSPEMLDVVWNELLRLPDEDIGRNMARRRFVTEYSKFVRVMRVMMAWIIKRRRDGERIQLNDVDLRRYLGVSEELGVKRRRGAWRKFRTRCGQQIGGNEWREVRRVAEELRDCSAKVYLRGKFELWFFVRFVERLAEGMRKRGPKQTRPKSPVTLTLGNAVVVLGARWSVDASLEAFLNRHLEA